MNFEFSKAEFSELISAAREARIRWKKAKTLWKVRHHAYLKHDENELEENIERFANVEKMLIERYRETTGETLRQLGGRVAVVQSRHLPNCVLLG